MPHSLLHAISIAPSCAENSHYRPGFRCFMALPPDTVQQTLVKLFNTAGWIRDTEIVELQIEIAEFRNDDAGKCLDGAIGAKYRELSVMYLATVKECLRKGDMRTARQVFYGTDTGRSSKDKFGSPREYDGAFDAFKKAGLFLSSRDRRFSQLSKEISICDDILCSV